MNRASPFLNYAYSWGASIVIAGTHGELDKACEFMKKFVIKGKSMLDKFLEWIGEKVRDGRGR